MIRGIVTSIVEGVIKRFSASGGPDETIDNREYFQHYGFTSRPKAGAEIIIIREGGHFIAIGSDDRRYRITLADGEVALYTDEGDKVHLKRGRIIEIIGGEKIIATTKVAEITATTSATVTSPLVNIVASTKVTMTTPLVEMSGNLVVTGTVAAAGIGAGVAPVNGKILVTGDIKSTGGEVGDKTRNLSADRLIYNGHTHVDPQGGSTAVPTGLM